VIGGGLPIGVVAGAGRYLDALDGGQWNFGDASFPEVGVTFFAGTFVRHPITIAAARAVLEHLKREGPALQQRVTALTEDAASQVRDLIERYQAPLHLAQFSSMMYLTVRPEFKHGGLLFYLLRERGIHIFENRAFVFTTAHSPADGQPWGGLTRQVSSRST
jgi:glutamate-1-semialdehyde aminotransferase